MVMVVVDGGTCRGAVIGRGVCGGGDDYGGDGDDV